MDKPVAAPAVGAKEKIDKQARQLAYDTRYKVKQSMKVDLVGHLSSLLYKMYLKLKQIPILVMKEQNITVKNVAVITDIYLMMGPNPQEKGSVTTVFA